MEKCKNTERAVQYKEVNNDIKRGMRGAKEHWISDKLQEI